MCALLQRDMVTLIEVDEVRGRTGVLLVEEPGKDTQRPIIDARVMSRVEVALENDDEDPGELSRLAGLHLGLGDVKDAFHRFLISKLYSSFFALPEVQCQEVGAPLVGRVCSCFSSLPMGHALRFFFSVRKRPTLVQILQDTQSCIVPRPSEEDNGGSPSHRASKRFIHVYVDDLGVLGTSRVNADMGLMMAVQTLKKIGSGNT